MKPIALPSKEEIFIENNIELVYSKVSSENDHDRHIKDI